MKRALLLAAACGAKAAPMVAPAPVHHCDGVTVDAKPAPGTTYPSWLAAWTALAHPPSGDVLIPDGTPPPTDDAGARALLCGDSGCPDTGPWIVGAGTPGNLIEFSLAIPQGSGLVVFPEIAGGAGGNCQYQDDVDTTPGAYFEIAITRNEPGDTDCGKVGDEVDYAWFDTQSATRVLAITTDSRTKITTTAKSVHAIAGACTEDVPL
jgi:hypothetical protein